MADPDPRRALEQRLAGLREQLERDRAEGKLAGISVEELADAISHPKAPDVIAETMGWEAASVQAGEPAPDFTLPFLPGSAGDRRPTVTLSDHFGRRPVALVFGSYT